MTIRYRHWYQNNVLNVFRISEHILLPCEIYNQIEIIRHWHVQVDQITARTYCDIIVSFQRWPISTTITTTTTLHNNALLARLHRPDPSRPDPSRPLIPTPPRGSICPSLPSCSMWRGSPSQAVVLRGCPVSRGPGHARSGYNYNTFRCVDSSVIINYLSWDSVDSKVYRDTIWC